MTGLLFHTESALTWEAFKVLANVISAHLSADDLTLAARSGNFEGVLMMLHHPAIPVPVNALNTDGVTATYCALLMIMKDEMLDAQCAFFEDVLLFSRVRTALLR